MGDKEEQRVQAVRHYVDELSRSLDRCARHYPDGDRDVLLWNARRAAEAVALALLEIEGVRPARQQQRSLHEYVKTLASKEVIDRPMSHQFDVVRTTGNLGSHTQSAERSIEDRHLDTCIDNLRGIVEWFVASPEVEKHTPLEKLGREALEALKERRRLRSEVDHLRDELSTAKALAADRAEKLEQLQRGLESRRRPRSSTERSSGALEPTRPLVDTETSSKSKWWLAGVALAFLLGAGAGVVGTHALSLEAGQVDSSPEPAVTHVGAVSDDRIAPRAERSGRAPESTLSAEPRDNDHVASPNEPARAEPRELSREPRFILVQPENDVPFLIQDTEATVEQFRACVEAGACEPLPSASESIEPQHHPELCSLRAGANPMLPINCITAAEANRLCAWLGTRATSTVGRLPTTTEWKSASEWASLRTGVLEQRLDRDRPNLCDQHFVRQYPSDAHCQPDHASARWIDGEVGPGPVATHEVANTLGLEDVLGNVSEFARRHGNLVRMGRGFRSSLQARSRATLGQVGADSRFAQTGVRCAVDSNDARVPVGTD